MARRKPLVFTTAFAVYTMERVLGEGGAGRVYGVIDEQGARYALKLLSPEKATREKLRRFKNEYRFCQRNRHPHIVTVLDAGITEGDKPAPFYVMPLFDGSLRSLLDQGVERTKVLPLFAQILNGVEAAHLLDVVHRDLKPENILWSKSEGSLVVSDFGVARFSQEQLYTVVETAAHTRLANFLYSAPEQRTKGSVVDRRSDIYALGLILNEMFTGEVPHGTSYRTIGSVEPTFAYLDDIVARMLSQQVSDRPVSIEEIKRELIARRNEFVALQRVSEIQQQVVPTSDIDDPLVADPVRLVNADWEDGVLTLFFQHNIPRKWIDALHNMGGYTSMMGKPPQSFAFRGKTATIDARAHEAQQVIDYFKQWIPRANQVYEYNVIEDKRRAEERAREAMRQELERQQTRANVIKNLRI